MGLADLDQLRDLGYTVLNGVDGSKMVSGLGRQWVAFTDADADRILVEAQNFAAMVGKMRDALAFFSDNYRNWGTLTAQQKDGAARQAQRALANLIRYVLNDMTTAGD